MEVPFSRRERRCTGTGTSSSTAGVQVHRSIRVSVPGMHAGNTLVAIPGIYQPKDRDPRSGIQGPGFDSFGVMGWMSSLLRISSVRITQEASCADRIFASMP